MILTWWQLKDGVADHGFFRSLPYRAALLALGRAYRKARARRPGFDERTRAHLEELARLEGERCPSMDRAADAFAVLLAGAAEEEPDPVRRRVLRQLLYHLGRWIYLVDAADDLKKDVKSGSYNPLVYRFHAEGGTLTAEDRAALAPPWTAPSGLWPPPLSWRISAPGGLLSRVLYTRACTRWARRC